jgi:hypothetical protein
MQERQLKAIVEATIQAAMADIVKLAVQAVMENTKKAQQKEVNACHDRRLRNTRLLLKNYHLLKKHCENSVCNVQQASEKASDVLVSINDLDKDAYIQSIRSSVTRTYIILSHIDEMLRLYKIYCDVSDKEEDRRRNRILIAVYFSEKKAKMEDLCRQEQIDERTYYRDVRDGCEKLSTLIFGFDGLADVSKSRH